MHVHIGSERPLSENTCIGGKSRSPLNEFACAKRNSNSATWLVPKIFASSFCLARTDSSKENGF